MRPAFSPPSVDCLAESAVSTAPTRHRAFTLVELLVAMGVTVLFLAILLQVSSQVLRATGTTRDQLESLQRGRSALDALAADLANRVADTNAPLLFRRPDGPDGNIELLFLTRSRGPSSSTDFRFMAVAYELTADQQLIRKTAEISWDDPFLGSSLLGAASSAQATVVAEGIQRFDAVAMLSDGSVRNLIPTQNTDWTTGDWQGIALGDSRALAPQSHPIRSQAPPVRATKLMVGVAALDRQGVGKLTQLGIDLPGDLPVARDGSTPVQDWDEARSGAALNGLPSDVRSALQFSQQTYDLP